MSRPLRLHVAGGFYHVTMRGNHRQDIFFESAHRDWLEEIVAEVVERFGARVHAYCWMTNHIHLLIQVSDAPLGRIMLRIASRYARTVQSRLQTTGHLFERRYHAILVDQNAYLLTLLRYIHQNPLKAQMVTSLADYRWSSHAAYAGQRSQSWVTTDFALGMLHRERSMAVQAYLRLVDELVPCEDLAPHQDDERVLGDDRFISRVLGIASRPRSRKSLEDLMAEVCITFCVTVDELRSRSKSRVLTRARAWYAQTAIDLGVASNCEVARTLCRHEASIRGLIRRHAK